MHDELINLALDPQSEPSIIKSEVAIEVAYCLFCGICSAFNILPLYSRRNLPGFILIVVRSP